MPLLNKKPFEKNGIPPDLKDTDKVFYCDVTREIFDNYQEFAERIILCNSLVWACEETGKSGLTYLEALEHEKNAKKLLNDFPVELRRPILYLLTLTCRSALADVADDIFAYIRDRYFVGETLEYNVSNDSWIPCRVLQVTSPTSKELVDVKNTPKTNEKHTQFWPPGCSYHYEIECLETKDIGCDDVNNVTTVLGAKLRRKKSTYTRDRNYLFVKHSLTKVDGVWRVKANTLQRFDIVNVKFEEIFAGQPPKFNRSETPKKSSSKKSTTTPTTTTTTTTCSSSSPTKSSPQKNGVVNKTKKQESIDKYLKPKTSQNKQQSLKRGSAVCNGTLSSSAGAAGITTSKNNKNVKDSNKQLQQQQQPNTNNNSNNSNNSKKSVEKRKSTEEILERELLEKRRRMMEHQQQLIEKKQQKQLDVQRKRDEKKKLEEFYKEWSKTREDLELEDLKELPTPLPVALDTPNEYFGHLVMLYEFFHNFAEPLGVKNFFPAGVTFDLLDRAVSRYELAGPLIDLIHLLLSAIFKLQEDEEDEMGETYDTLAVNNIEKLDVDIGDSGGGSGSGPSPIEFDDDTAAAVAINWPIAFQGVPLQKLTVDATTITEILRLHLLSSGSRVTETCARWRSQEKGGYTSNDDPAVAFRCQNGRIMRELNEKCVTAFSIADKIAVLECLTNQAALSATIRDIVNTNVENCRQKRIELRLSLAAELRKERELAQKRKEKRVATKTAAAAAANAANPINTSKEDDQNFKNSNHHHHQQHQQQQQQTSAAAAAVAAIDTTVFEKLDKDIQKRKDDLKKQLAELNMENAKVQLMPVGTDRAYRRFWIFPTIPGIFVENDERCLPACLPRGTPEPNTVLMKEKDTLSYVRKLFQKEYNKENLGGVANVVINSPRKRNASTSIASMTTLAASSSSSSSSTSTSTTTTTTTTTFIDGGGGGGGSSGGSCDEQPNRVPLSCWGDADTCPVHCAHKRNPIKWSYFRTENDYENLMDSLNSRGKRESKLKANLTEQRDFILKNIARPFINFNKYGVGVALGSGGGGCGRDENNEIIVTEIRKSSRGNPTYENSMYDFPSNADMDHVLESLLRNVILDIEEKTNAGGLGNLKVTDRNKWLDAISNNTYDAACEKLVWGLQTTENDTAVIEDTSDECKSANVKEKKYANLKIFDVLYTRKYTNGNVNPKVKDLAGAILQLEQSIELHYLKPPLGAEKNKIYLGVPTNILTRWESSLMRSTNFSQLFLHIFTLDKSIAWNRSALNANCRICRRRGDPENMLLCDMCNKGHHLYCLKPKLTKIPKGDWFCHYCKPPSKESRSAARRKFLAAIDSDDEAIADKKASPLTLEKMDLCEKGKCDLCREKGLTIGCSKCTKRYHLTCLLPPLRKLPSVNWSCHACRRVSAKKDDNDATTTTTTTTINGGGGSDIECSAATEPLRVSRRQTSKAANEKIYRFVKQLRKPNSSDEDEQFNDENEETISTLENGRRGRRTRNSLESNYTSNLPLDNAALQELLNKIMRHDDAWPFLRPVSRFEAADYLQIVKRPMDFATIKHKLNMLQYHTNSQVINDSMLVFDNCFLYNKDTSEVYQTGVRLLHYFKKLCDEMNFKRELEEAENQSSKINKDIENFDGYVVDTRNEEEEEVEEEEEEEGEEGEEEEEEEEVEEEEDEEEDRVGDVDVNENGNENENENEVMDEDEEDEDDADESVEEDEDEDEDEENEEDVENDDEMSIDGGECATASTDDEEERAESDE